MKWFGKILSGAGMATDLDKIMQIVQAGKSETIEDVRNLRQVEDDNAKQGLEQDLESGQGDKEDRGAGLGEKVLGMAAGQGAMMQDLEAGQVDTEDQGAGLGEMVWGMAAGRGAMIKSETIEDVRTLRQVEADNARYGFDHKEDQSHEEMTGHIRKRLAKDGVLRWDEERDASFQGAKKLTKTHTGNIAKTHNGKGLIHDDS